MACLYEKSIGIMIWRVHFILCSFTWNAFGLILCKFPFYTLGAITKTACARLNSIHDVNSQNRYKALGNKTHCGPKLERETEHWAECSLSMSRSWIFSFELCLCIRSLVQHRNTNTNCERGKKPHTHILLKIKSKFTRFESIRSSIFVFFFSFILCPKTKRR